MKYLVLGPVFPNYKTNQLKGVLIYFHPTVFGKRQIPTKYGNQIKALAALYCTQGYAMVIPDYIGYEFDSNIVHPYILYPQQNVQSAISALNDVKLYLNRYYEQEYDLFSVGYSEGAAYSLWMEKCLTDPEACEYNYQKKLKPDYHFKGSIGLEGPYDLKDVVYPFLIQNINEFSNYRIMYQAQTNYGKPGLAAMVFNSYMYFENILDISKIYQNQFYNLQCPSQTRQNCMINNIAYQNLTEILSADQNSINVAKAIAFSAFGKMQYGLTYLSVIQRFYDIMDNNNVLALINKEISSQKPFTFYLQNSSAIINAPSKKVFIFSLDRDSIVSVRNSEKYFADHNPTNRVKFEKFANKQHIICDPKLNTYVDHNGAQILANVYALAFINNQTSST